MYIGESKCHFIEKWEKIKKPLKLAFKLVCFDTNQYVRGGIVDYADSFKSHVFYLG